MRRSVNKRSAGNAFKKRAGKTHKKNTVTIYRGGIRE